MSNTLPSIIVTGASGIVGRYFLEFIKDDFLIYAIARRSQKEVEIPEHPNIKWIHLDISNKQSVESVMQNIYKQGGADFVLHLAGYYDFDNSEKPEYERTNVQGTHYMLEQAKMFNIKRFIYASTTTVSKFPLSWENLTEKSPHDAIHPYPISKQKGERLVQDYSKLFPCSIVRFAAVFTDWCEYGPLYVFLTTWLSKKLTAKILGGKGESAVPYIHVNDLNRLLINILNKSDNLPDFDVYAASANGSTSHRELFEISTRYFFGHRKKPLFLHKYLASVGVILRDILGRLLGKRPFERFWMIKFLDLKMNMDSSYTQKALSWSPTARFSILRRLLYLVEKMKSNPDIWHFKNTQALKHVAKRPNWIIYEVMLRLKDEINDENRKVILNPERNKEFPNYQKENIRNFNWDTGVFYQLLTLSVRNNDRMILLDYINNTLVPIRFKEGFESNEVCRAILETGKIVISRLMKEPELKGIEQLIHDNITMTIQLTVDEVESAFEKLGEVSIDYQTPDRSDIEDKLQELTTFYKPHEKTKILIVDDDVEFVNAVKITLENLQYNVITAYNKEDGLEKVGYEKPDLSILDIMMPAMQEGFELAREIRKNSRFNDMPILILTGAIGVTNINFRSIVNNPDWMPVEGLIEKPVLPHVLLNEVKKIIEIKTEYELRT